MIKIDLKNEVQEEPILELETEKGIVDLHNDYICSDIVIDPQFLKLVFEYDDSIIDYSPRSTILKVHVLFEKYNSDNIEGLERNIGLSLDNLSKSQLKNNKFFYIFSFTEGDEYELECDNVFLILMD